MGKEVLKVEHRQLCAEVGELMFKKRDLDLELAAVNQSLSALIKRRDEIKRSMDESAD